MKPRFVLLLTFAGILFLTSCATKIGRINADPSRYSNRTVTVTGTVVNSMGLLGTGGYQIEDDTGKIYVISGTGVPNRGARVTVTGRVQSGVSLMGRSFGTAIREHHHKVKW